MAANRLVMVFLQNAWTSGDYKLVESDWPTPPGISPDEVWRRWAWLTAFHASRSGQRWSRILEPELPGLDFWFDNTTPHVASESSGVCKPIRPYVQALLDGEIGPKRVPDIVVACGAQAAEVLEQEWAGDMVIMPHPANRVLTDILLHKVRYWLGSGQKGRIRMVQGRGVVRKELLKV